VYRERERERDTSLKMLFSNNIEEIHESPAGYPVFG
jgi:hypothetical protein